MELINPIKKKRKGYESKPKISFYSSYTVGLSIGACNLLDLSSNDRLIFGKENGQLYVRKANTDEQNASDGFIVKKEAVDNNRLRIYRNRALFDTIDYHPVAGDYCKSYLLVNEGEWYRMEEITYK